MDMKRERQGAGGFEGFAFSRTVGVKHWCCPVCNQVNRATIRPQTWVVECSNEACSARFAIGEVFYEVTVGKRVPPPDTLMPRALYVAGERINKVFCSGCGALMYREGFKRAWEDETPGALNALGDSENAPVPGMYVAREWEKVGDDKRYPKGIQKLKKRGWKREALNEEIAG